MNSATDATTRKVIVVLAGLFGTTFLVLGTFALARSDGLVIGILNILLGLVWLTGAVLMARKAHRV